MDTFDEFSVRRCRRAFVVRCRSATDGATNSFAEVSRFKRRRSVRRCGVVALWRCGVVASNVTRCIACMCWHVDMRRVTCSA